MTTEAAPTAPAVGDGATQEIGIFQHDVTSVPPMLFEVPENFLAYPLTPDQAERDAAALQLARQMYKNGDEALWASVAPTIATMGQIGYESSLAWSGMALFDNEQGGVANCTLTVAATESDHMDPEIAALGLREMLVRDEFNESRWLNLPCGPAVSRITATRFPLNLDNADGPGPADTGVAGERTELVQCQIQVYIPFPTGPYIAVLTMSTMSLEAWEELSIMMATIVGSVRFPGAPGSPEAVGDGAAPAESEV